MADDRRCARCWRAACVCDLLPAEPVGSAAGLLILQHPRERHAFKGSARLLSLCITDSQWVQGERWVGPLPAARNGRLAAAPLDVLLYPCTDGDPALPRPPALPKALAHPADPTPAQRAPVRLVVIDATWRKAYRMLAESPSLQALPRWPLQDPPPSRYRVRRARGASQRSTFEAAVLGLAALNGPDWPLAPLMAVFDAFNARLAAQMAAQMAGR